MPITSLRINHLSIQKKIDAAIANSPVIKRLAYQKAYGVFRHAKRTMLREFDRHNITQELLAGPNAVNISGTLDGYGNLFSFIGFERGSEPTQDLRQLLELGTTFEQTIYRNKVWYFRVKTPTKEAISEVTQMPFERGNSWAFAVETYISGLSHYLYKRNLGGSSRSGSGLQVGVQGGNSYYEYLEDVTFTGKPYITEILNNFRDRVNKER
jgi:hypothetical protein